jgi:hypothetical protein
VHSGRCLACHGTPVTVGEGGGRMRDVPILLNLRRPGLTRLRCRHLPSAAPGASQWGCSSGSSPSSSSAHGRACRCGCTVPTPPPPPPPPPRQQQQRGVGRLLHLFTPWLTPCLTTYSARPADLDHGALTDQPRPPPTLLRFVPQIQGVVAAAGRGQKAEIYLPLLHHASVRRPPTQRLSLWVAPDGSASLKIY